ncbi:putative sodium-dependent multivitamin like protein [Argiope bruennichi]|uniref:Putative sodium-dependent multivitamin like protein n=1 Tax=Argiope bruennichi TaxID=94029 RepID=A0A8T0E0A4_ARGBR|nr:putative sodium-dependent multivitamin like protein [Argiope bruennichi]
MGFEKATLGILDYILITIMLLISSGIGLYFRFSGGKQKTTNEYLLAGKNMPILPVAFSIMASYLSAISVIGTPAEVYMFGIHLLFSNIVYPVGVLAASYVCLPVFFKMGACTAYEYLEKRFGKLTRTFTSVVFILQTILYMPIVLYAPALALSAATNLSTWTSVLSVGTVCTFYCTLGGMKAVLWTDLFQALLMFIGIFAVLITGFSNIGFSEVFRVGYEGGRIVVPGFSLNLTERYTIWNVFLKGFIMSLITFGANQIQIQRLLTLKNISRCRKTLYLGIAFYTLFHGFTYIVGLVIYAHYNKCDPLTAPNKPISAADQLLPYYMINVLGAIPGLPGLCICGVFGAALSTVSSAMNSLSAVTIQDLVKPFLKYKRYSEKTMTLFAKVLTLFFGILCILMTVMADSLGNLIQAAFTVYGMCGAPILAVFLLGMLTTRTNEKGALIGLLSSLCMTAWVSFGASARRVRPKILPLSTEGCIANSSLFNTTSSSILSATVMSMLPETSTLSTTSAIPKIRTENPPIFPLYRISYMWYAPFGLLIGLTVGYISSIIISRITGEYPDVADEFVSPVLINFTSKKKSSKDQGIEIQAQEEAEHLTNGVSIHHTAI